MEDLRSPLVSELDLGKSVLEDPPNYCRVMVIFSALQTDLDREILVG